MMDEKIIFEVLSPFANRWTTCLIGKLNADQFENKLRDYGLRYIRKAFWKDLDQREAA